ncbi:MAG: hypothetical protein HY791_29230 [Deltaproteobacteria bacterium]|nr:hypothetical protein [Deltaproteobacteria bacterium]
MAESGNGTNGMGTVIEILREIAAESRRANDRLDRMEARQDRAEQRQDRMEQRQDRVEQRQDRMEQRQDRVELNLAALAQIVKDGFDRVDKSIQETNRRIDDLNQFLRLQIGAMRGALEHDDQRFAVHARLEDSERRIEALEKKTA